MNEFIAPLISAAAAAVVVWAQVNSNRKLEHLRSQLLQVSDRRRTLFERRINVLATVYGKLVDAHEAYQDFLNSGTRFSNMPTPSDRHQVAVVAGEEFRKAFTRTRILIPVELGQKLDEISREFISLANRFSVERITGKDENQALLLVYQKTEGKIKTALSDLDSAFRNAIESQSE
jgi:hypothetical protein